MSTVSEGLERAVSVEGSQSIYLKANLIAALRAEAQSQLSVALMDAWKQWDDGPDLEDLDALKELGSALAGVRAALEVLVNLAPVPAEESEE